MRRVRLGKLRTRPRWLGRAAGRDLLRVEDVIPVTGPFTPGVFAISKRLARRTCPHLEFHFRA